MDRAPSPAPRRPGGHTRSPTSPHRSGAGSTSGRLSSQYQASVSSSNTSHSHNRWQSDMDDHELGMSPRSVLSGIEEDLDPLQQHYVNAYSATELKTFHCDRVRKMPLSGLDPSMLIGFFCRGEDDWKDFRKKVEEVNIL
jgi:cysteine protease ATG4